MAIASKRPNRKVTGSRYVAYRHKRVFELMRLPTLTKLGEKSTMSLRGKGGIKKTVTLVANTANVYIPKQKKYVQAKIKTIVDNAANRHFIRRNIITKGAILDTEVGKARVTSRPGQEGAINAVLIE